LFALLKRKNGRIQREHKKRRRKKARIYLIASEGSTLPISMISSP
jgi:hypothetical protein